MVIIWTTPAVMDLENYKNNTKKINFTYVQGTIIRQLIYREHKIYYSINDENIHILAVIHSRQDTKQRLKYIKEELN